MEVLDVLDHCHMLIGVEGSGCVAWCSPTILTMALFMDPAMVSVGCCSLFVDLVVQEEALSLLVHLRAVADDVAESLHAHIRIVHS